MKLLNAIGILVIAAGLSVQPVGSVSAADHRDGTIADLSLLDVTFYSFLPVVDPDGSIVGAIPVEFSATTYSGTGVEGRGELTFLGANSGGADHVRCGRIDGIIGSFSTIRDGTSKTFIGRAQARFESIEITDAGLTATGDMQLRAQVLEPVLVREFNIEGEAVRGGDGRWNTRFHGQDIFGFGVRIDGIFVPSREWNVWDDTDVVHARGNVEALGFLDENSDPVRFDDTAGAEQINFLHDGPGSLGAIVPQMDAGDRRRFTAELTLGATGRDGLGSDGEDVRLVNIQVDDVRRLQSKQAPDGRIRGRAEIAFSGVAEHDHADVEVAGTAEFRFYGEAMDGHDWFMASGQFLVVDGTLEVNGAVEDVSGRKARAKIVGTIDPSGTVDLSDGLGQVAWRKASGAGPVRR